MKKKHEMTLKRAKRIAENYVCNRCWNALDVVATGPKSIHMGFLILLTAMTTDSSRKPENIMDKIYPALPIYRSGQSNGRTCSTVWFVQHMDQTAGLKLLIKRFRVNIIEKWLTFIDQ